MDCRTFKKLFSPFLDGTLDKRRTESASGHLSVCPYCNRLVRSYRAGTESLARTPQIEPKDDLFDSVMQAVKSGPAVKRRPAPVLVLRPRIVVPGLAAAAALALALGFFMFSGGSQPQQVQYITLVDSTMDMINYQVTEQLARKEDSQRTDMVQLVSYTRVDEKQEQEPEVDPNPVIVLSGISELAE
jgi:hypothetical protein